jgi:hypothetical protein
MQDHLLDNLRDQQSEAAKSLVEHARRLAQLNQALSNALQVEVSVCRFEQGRLVIQVNDGSVATRLRYRTLNMLSQLSAVLGDDVIRVDIKVGPHPTWLRRVDGQLTLTRPKPLPPKPMSRETGDLLLSQSAVLRDPGLSQAFKALSAHAFVTDDLA